MQSMRVLRISVWYGLAVLASAGCHHGGGASAPSTVSKPEAPIISTWTQGQPAPAWPTGPAGTNLQVRVWTAPNNCQGTPPTREQREATPAASYFSLAIGEAVAIAPNDNPSDATYVQSGNRRVAETTLVPGRYCLTISNHTCLVDLTVPSEAGAPFVIQPLPDPATDHHVPGVTVDTSTGVVRLDVLPPVAGMVPPCS
jgi:hypothetical protein